MDSNNLSTAVQFLVKPDAAGAGLETLEAMDTPLAFSPSVVTTALRTARPVGARVGFEALFGRPNFLPAWFLEIGSRRARAIGLVRASGTNFLGETGDWSGTGILVSPSVLLTNNHVLNSREVAQEAGCVFNFQDDELGRPMPTKRFTFDPDRLFVTSSALDGLDFTFVWVNGEPGHEFGWVPLTRDSLAVAVGDFANIIQHPKGEPKQVVLQENEVKQAQEVVIHYQSDTEHGSSGACVFDNTWRAVALHHASSQGEDNDPATFGDGTPSVNEGIRFSAIAAYLDKLTEQPETRPQAEQLLQAFEGTDPLMGFFGALGRTAPPTGTPFEILVDTYQGEADDIDVGFWNIEHFEDHYHEKLEDVGRVIIEMNLDLWAFEESSPAATQALVDHLKDRYEVEFDWAASEPGEQVTTVMWNTRTVDGKHEAWPDEIDGWFSVHSDDFDDLPFESGLTGSVFPRYPGLFSFKAANRAPQDAFDFLLVPLHLKAYDIGSMRRRMASRILAVAIKKMIDEHGADQDWVLGGDLNATLASDDLQALSDGGLEPVSANDEDAGAITYIKSPHLSLIDHIFLSPNLTQSHGADDFFIVARDRNFPDYLTRVSDHRPILIRLSLGHGASPHEAAMAAEERGRIPASLREALAAFAG